MSMSVHAAAGEPKTKVRWKIFFVLLSLVSINHIDRASLSVAMPLISKEFDLDPAMQGLILSSFFWTYALMQIPGGMLADRFKPRIVIAAAAVFWGAFQGLAGLCASATGAADALWPGRSGSADLSGWRQTECNVDDTK